MAVHGALAPSPISVVSQPHTSLVRDGLLRSYKALFFGAVAERVAAADLCPARKDARTTNKGLGGIFIDFADF